MKSNTVGNRKFTRTISFIVIMLYYFIISVPATHANFCIHDGTPKWSVEHSDVVFIGTISNVEKGDTEFDSPSYTVIVDRVYKGSLFTTVFVKGSYYSGDLPVGDKFLIYAYESGWELGVQDCIRPLPFSSATQDLIYLDENYVSYEPAEPNMWNIAVRVWNAIPDSFSVLSF